MSVINFSGLASGIDTESLIKASSDATRAQRVTPSQTKVTQLTDTNTNLDDLKTKLGKLQTAIKEFSTLNGGGVVKQGTSSDETKVTATASNAALDATYSVTVSSLAKNGTVSLGPAAGTYTTSTDTISAGTSEVITIGTGGSAETITVPITAGVTTITDFVNSFNQQSTKATASLVNVGTTASPSYRVVINSNKTGTEDGSISVDTNAGGFAAPTTSAATDATFSIAGIGSITRASNAVSDVIVGVTLNLKSAGTSNINIAADATATTTLVQDMVTAWNDVVSFVKEKDQITRQESGTSVTNIFGPLASTRVDDDALISLRNAISSVSYAPGATPTNEIRIFADLGITTQRDGTLALNTKTLESAIGSESVSVSEILSSFADTVATTSGTIDKYIQFNGLLDIEINSNKNLVTNLNERIASAEASIAQQEAAMRTRFAALESNVSKLQSQQGALSSALAGLGR